ncbi:MAG: aldehyde dehydrogenase family protein [Ignavibacteriae bacterium]|nr:aldehyde dehydrogenase family protein [Ignavibacteriota bacterium]
MVDQLLSEEIKSVFELQQLNRKSLAETSAKVRKEKLKRILNYVIDHSTDIENVVFNDFKKPSAEVKLTEIFPVTSEIRHVIRHLNKWMKPERVGMPLTFFGSSAKIYREPKGVSLIISPWNFPFQLLIGPFISAVAAGCPVILKPSEYSSTTSDFLKKMITELFPKEEAYVVLGNADVSKFLTSLPFDHIFFTGGTSVGKQIMKSASQNLTSVTLELGGKSPCIVDSDYDLKNAARRIVWGKFMNAGQTCVAPDYVLINELKLKEFVKYLKIYSEKFSENSKENYEYSHIINDSHFEKLNFLLEQSTAEGAVIEFGGKRNKEKRFFEFTVLSNVDRSNAIMKEEIFGPILPILTYKSYNELEEIVDENSNPLALYIFSSKKEFINKIRNRIKSGALAINDVVVHFSHPNLPFGGVNQSGIGKAHGKFGFYEFTNAKGIFKQPKYSANLLFYPPYTRQINKLIDLLIKYF